MEARTVPFNYCVRWIKCSMEISQRYYSLFLGCGLLVFMSTIFIGLIPYLGTVAHGCLLLLYTVGLMRLIQQIRATQTATFDDFLKYVFDAEMLKRFGPYLGILAGLATVSVVAQFFRFDSVTLIFSMATNFLSVVFAYAAYMVLQNPSLDLKSAAQTVLSGIWQNILTWLCVGGLLVVFATVCAILCFLPLLFYFIPMTLPVTYLVYASIFEGLDIEATIAEWSSKSRAVQTLDAPRDGV